MDIHKFPIKDVNITRTFLTGLVTILPIVVTIYLLVWLGDLAESFLGRMIRVVLPESLYVPGMGLLAGLVLILLIGILMHAWIVRRTFEWSERVLYRIPVIRTVYGATRDFIQFLMHSRDPGFHEVVMVDIGDSGMQVIGFITRPDTSGLPEGAARDDDAVLVYLPLSYQIGGYTVLIPRSALRPIDMSMRAAMAFVLTGGVTAPHAPPGRTPPDISGA
ncbi:MAG: DUF502 domain-containing protein [Gammaproteobacteria bacterium]|jgi:uncharacterized membrane protein